MKDIGNTKAQLTDEVRSLRQKIAELEARVTVGKQAEGKLKESEESYRNLIETSPYAIFVHIDQKIIFMNPAGLELLGAHNSSEVIGKSLLDFTHPDYLEVIKRRQELLKKGDAPRNEYFKAIRLDGSVIDVEIAAARRMTYQGKSAILSTLHDITDRLKAEELIEKSRTQYRDIVNNSVLGMAVYVPGQPLVFTNKRMTEITGYSVEEIESPDFNFMVLFTEEDQRLITANIKRRFTGEYIPPYESMLIPKTGDRKWVLIYNINTEYEGESAIQVQLLDISERKQAEETLQESEEKYRGIFDESVAAIYVFDAKKYFIDSNQAGLDLLGYSREELLTMSIPDVDADPVVVLSAHEQLLSGERIINYEHQLKRKDGRIITVLNNSRPLTDAHGNVIGMQSTLIDITERKQAEEELRKHREHLEELVKERTTELRIKDNAVNTSISAIALSDLEGILTYVNRSFLELWGYDSEDEVLGKPAKGFWQAEEKAAEVVEALRKKKGYWLGELTAKRKNGSKFDVQIAANLVRDEDGNPISMMSSFLDITERKRAQEKIKAQKKFTDNVIDSLPDTFYIFDPETGKGIQWNKTLSEISGYDYKEMSELPPLHFYPPEEHQLVEEVVKTTLEKGRATVELNYIIADGTRIPFEYSTVLIKDAEGKPCICSIGRDITKRKEMEEKLVRQEKLAVLGQLAGGVGHELRNPLGAIKNAAYFLNMVLEEPEPEVKETLDILEREVATSERIISSLLGFARPKPPIRRKVDINEVIQEALYHVTVPENVKVVTQLDKSLPTILADPDQLGQAFSNIIVNAIQAMPAGGQLAIKSKASNQKWVSISFADTGVGIPKENLKKLFEPLFSTKAKGIGLGLAVTKTLVEGHGGTIEAQSKVGKGSTFTVRLPIAGGREK